ncbi:MAG: ExbD/TolR family protein [Saezia sp.]
MKFRHRQSERTPEINLIPFIDVLLVIIIFLLLTTTYTRISALQIRLPDANAQTQDAMPHTVNVIITSDGIFAVNDVIVQDPNITTLSHQLLQAAQKKQDAIVVISADGYATHQSVVMVMDAARHAGLPRLTFTTKTPDTK